MLQANFGMRFISLHFYFGAFLGSFFIDRVGGVGEDIGIAYPVRNSLIDLYLGGFKATRMIVPYTYLTLFGGLFHSRIGRIKVFYIGVSFHAGLLYSRRGPCGYYIVGRRVFLFVCGRTLRTYGAFFCNYFRFVGSFATIGINSAAVGNVIGANLFFGGLFL